MCPGDKTGLHLAFQKCLNIYFISDRRKVALNHQKQINTAAMLKAHLLSSSCSSFTRYSPNLPACSSAQPARRALVSRSPSSLMRSTRGARKWLFMTLAVCGSPCSRADWLSSTRTLASSFSCSSSSSRAGNTAPTASQPGFCKKNPKDFTCFDLNVAEGNQSAAQVSYCRLTDCEATINLLPDTRHFYSQAQK